MGRWKKKYKRICFYCGKEFDAKTPRTGICYDMLCQSRHRTQARALQRMKQKGR